MRPHAGKGVARISEDALQVDDERFGAKQIRALYENIAYPLVRATDSTPNA